MSATRPPTTRRDADGCSQSARFAGRCPTWSPPRRAGHLRCRPAGRRRGKARCGASVPGAGRAGGGQLRAARGTHGQQVGGAGDAAAPVRDGRRRCRRAAPRRPSRSRGAAGAWRPPLAPRPVRRERCVRGRAGRRRARGPRPATARRRPRRGQPAGRRSRGRRGPRRSGRGAPGSRPGASRGKPAPRPGRAGRRSLCRRRGCRPPRPSTPRHARALRATRTPVPRTGRARR